LCKSRWEGFNTRFLYLDIPPSSVPSFPFCPFFAASLIMDTDDFDAAPPPAAAPSNPLIAEPAKSGRSNCKKCKGLIDKGTLRLGRVYDNGDRIMTSWYHPSCWPVPKKNFASVDEIEGWDTLSNEHKQIILDLVPGKPPRASGAAGASASHKVSASGSSGGGGGGGASGSILSFFGGATSAAASTSAGASSKTAPQTSRHLDESGGTFAEFVELCDRVANVGSTLSKSQLISSHLDALLARRIDPFLTVRLLMPSKSGNDLRVFSLKDKSLVVHMSTVLRCSEAAMSAHLESADDFGTTAEHFYAQRLAKIASTAAAAAAAIGEEGEEGEEGVEAADDTVSTLPPQGARLHLADVNGWLDRLAAPDTSPLSLLRELVGRCNLPSELRVAMRLISKDIRIGGGTAVVLKGVGGDSAYDRFKAQPEQLRAIVSECKGGPGGGLSAKAKAEGGAAAGAGSGSGSLSGVRVGRAFKPQLAGQCKSFDDPVTKFARGFYVEVKYDGERLQCHLKNGKVKFFSRSLKDPPETKVR